MALLFFILAVALGQDPGSFISPGPLSKHHHEVDGITQCMSCHSLGSGVDPIKCMECHDSVKAQVDQQRGFHTKRATKCAECHPDHRGAGASIVRLVVDDFDHQETGFQLQGEHGSLGCEQCHEDDSTWTGLKTGCLNCHDDPHGGDQSERSLLADCTACHTEIASDWKALPLPRATFDHTAKAFVDYVLEGRHTEAGCQDCHTDLRFLPTKHERCESCHYTPHGKQFEPRSCKACHTVWQEGFKIPDFDHEQTRFALRGAHTHVSCTRCHGKGKKAIYRPKRFERCESCHRDPHRGQFKPRDCDACHALSIPDFALAGFDHDTTDYPLIGGHRDVACDKCHGEGPASDYAELPADDCVRCHEDPHAERFAPDACSSCHADADWSVDGFDHQRTDFALSGKHVDVPCTECHGMGEERVLAPLPFASCEDCHAETNPHLGGFDDKSCDGCHATTGWDKTHFDHAEATHFALEDAHADRVCKDCHADPVFKDERKACADCHEPPRSHFAGDCGGCHLPTAWHDASLGDNGHDSTGFPLRGRHTLGSCEDCHQPGVPHRRAGRWCEDCHRGDDPHRHLIGNACGDCHSEMGWSQVRFRHEITGWPLRGRHRAASCRDCHATGFAGTPISCVRCHGRQRPNGGFHLDPSARECEVCHRPYNWGIATFPHGSTP